MMRISHRHVPVMACLLFVPSDLPKLRADLIVDSGVNESQADQPVSFALLGSSTIADLLYNPSNGNVVMDASEASGATITNFVLKNAPGGAGFVTGVAIFPFTSIFTTDTVTEISQTDGTAVGFTGMHGLGNVFPTAMTKQQLDSFLTTATYVGPLGTGVRNFETFVIPEPSAFFACGMVFIVLKIYAALRSSRQRPSPRVRLSGQSAG